MDVSDGVAGAAGYGCIWPLWSPFHGRGGRAALANWISQKERLSCLLDLDLWPFIFSDSFLVTLLLASFDAKRYSGELHPVGQVSSVRVWGCFLTDRRCNFSCCLPLPSLKFSFENHLLTTTHYFISNFIYLPHSWNSVPCTTECPLGSSPKKQLLCTSVYFIFIPCSSPLGICSFISGIW